MNFEFNTLLGKPKKKLFVDACDWYLDIHLAPKHSFFYYVSLRTQQGPIWRGQETRFDELGRRWVRLIDRLVIDDFGTLVEVPE